ncbi:TetR/AcrR family transcriptional regulator [Cohnella panacarvi]|uniref:TetR/AcrR family transcriptional regulator n=1 Tax=Cohnella panacarvi TaxID=400776 RepID=UPI00047A6967|nr:TetR/AcrR family transcriptional regulator [Cohnella panacarvi]
MASKQEIRSEETRKSIIEAASRLFGSKGYDAVTMREIAKEAGCSHATIYIYFKDKEALLQELSMPPLLSLFEQIDSWIARETEPDVKLKAISMALISFCLVNRNMYDLFLNVKAGRVDEHSPRMEINRLRNRLFGQLAGIIRECLRLQPQDDRIWMSARVYYYALHGMISTYAHSEESAEQLMERLQATFLHTFDVVLTGLQTQTSKDPDR